MLPIYLETKDPVWAWKIGLVACFLNGVIEIAGAFIAETVRRVTPRAALLSALAGIAITFISMDFTFKIFARPLVALLPMAIIFVAYFSHQRLPLGLPGGMVAIAVGTVLGWMLGTMRPLQIASEGAVNWIKNFRDNYDTLAGFKSENERLRQRIQTLEVERQRLLEAEATNRQLKALLDFRTGLPAGAITASIIANSANSWFQSCMRRYVF